jgi:hypothetical protein
VFEATYTDTTATDPFDPANGASFTISYAEGLYQIQCGTLKAKPGSLRIKMDGTIPPQLDQTVAGFCVDGMPICQKVVAPNTDFEISFEAQYGLMCSNALSHGSVIDLESIDPAQIKYFTFPEQVIEKAFIFTNVNTWQE